jgi:hypothetical protein
MREIQKADPKARRRAVILFSVAAIIGLGCILLLERYRGDLENYFVRHSDYLLAHPELPAFGLFILMLPIYFFALYLWRFGSSVVREQRFPPAGLAVTRDTPVLSGSAGVRRGRVIQALALLLCGCGLALPLVLWYAFSMLSGGT